MRGSIFRFLFTTLGLIVCLVGSHVRGANAEEPRGSNFFTRSCCWEPCPNLRWNCDQVCGEHCTYDCYFTDYCSEELPLIEPYCWEGVT